MKKILKKIGALALAGVMVMGLGVTAFGDANLSNGEVGGYTSPDTPIVQDKTVVLKKELTAYNVDETSIFAPTITYTYAITAGDANINVTDATTDHTSGVAATVPTKAGVGISDISITGTDANTIAWTNADSLTASSNGTANTKDLKISFSNVVFGAPGVYRYVITETASDYAASGVTETTDAAKGHTRYLDVYVKPADTYSNGSTAAEWDIYGFVCMYDNEAITPDGDTTTAGAVKTNGFVAATNDGTDIKADSYYTFNVTVSKTVENDNYAKANHEFPFTVLFTNAAVTQSIDVKSAVTGTANGFTDPAAAALSTGSTKGIVTVKDSSSVKYIGIPNGTGVEVYETNDMTGTTYNVSTSVDNGTATTDNNVTWGTKPTEAFAQANKAAYESTKAAITTTANADDDTAHSVAITNTLVLISPTGLALRFAPYILMFAAGIVIFVLGRRRIYD